jgi:hypothetical protein
MIIRKEIKQQPVTQIVIDQVYCDRCGKTVMSIAGIMRRRYTGCSIEGIILPESRMESEVLHVDSELCDDCQGELIDWIEAGAGPGPRVRNEIDAAKEYQL